MYAKIENWEVVKYPYSVKDMMKDNNMSIPKNPNAQVLTQIGAVRVTPTAQPEHNPMTQRVEEGIPVLDTGVWLQTWDVIDLTEDERANRQRDKKNAQVVTPRQARLALHAAGLLDQVNTAVQAAGVEAQIEWEYASTVERNSLLVETLVVTLGFTDEQMDELFNAASQY